LTDKSTILELEIDGIIVERIKYFGRIDMHRNISEFKRVYNLEENDNYAFFYYVKPLDKKTDNWDWEIMKWELKNSKK